MNNQVVQAVFHEYGEGIGEYSNLYRVDSFGDLIKAMTRDLESDWYAAATWVNSIGESFDVFIDDEGIKIYDEAGDLWCPICD